MPLVRMAVTNYRCFAQRVTVELHPVTVILGRNNSGKSALARVPVVCETGIVTDSPAPLNLDALDEEMLESFTDLVYGNRPHGSIDIELEFDGPDMPVRLAATVQQIDEYQTQVVSLLELRVGGTTATLEWEPRDPPEDLRYTIHSGEHRFTGIAVPFQGLLPINVTDLQRPDELTSFLSSASRIIRDSYPSIRYFGPFRDRPQRRNLLPARMPTSLGAGGKYAAAILISDVARQQGRLVREVNRLLADSLPGWSLDVVERGGTFSVALTTQGDDTPLSVNIADVGAGVAQVLPIFVQRALDVLSPPDRPVLEIIEQPELHLHPAAHGGLADLYLSAAQETRVRFIIETHSETFLLRLRRRVAEGLDPGTIAVYFVDHHHGAAEARRINVAADGSLDYWPPGIFSEDYEESKELASAQLARADGNES